MRSYFGTLVLFFLGSGSLFAADWPVVSEVEPQPLLAQCRRVTNVLELLGQPLSTDQRARIEAAAEAQTAAESTRVIQELFDPLCLAAVEINAESRVKADPGPAARDLIQGGWRGFLVKVRNDAGVTSRLRVESPNALKVYAPSTNDPEPKAEIKPGMIADRWMDLEMFDYRPIHPTLSGLPLEYRIIVVWSRDAGHREGKFRFDVGQGTQDLNFRNELDVLFAVSPSVSVTLDVLDVDGTPTSAAFTIRDRLRRVYPTQGKRLAPDFFFHPQIYREHGETVSLPPGVYDFEVRRGPEYLVERRSLTIPPLKEHRETFHLKRWISLENLGWYSGDHHIHAAGCGHYDSPTQGVTPEDMFRNVRGENLDVGCVLTWGPCWYHQKSFFEGAPNKLSTAKNLLRYDVEVSGFPSSHAGHLCLLRLKEDDFPGTTRIEEWPSWDLPILQWGKAQRGIVGFAHSGWGLETTDLSLPVKEIPPFDGIGANEYLVDVAQGAVDFISTIDTPAPWELSIWYHTLNCGFSTRISGETDFPCIYGDRVGMGRSYVKLADGPLDFDRWAEGIKLGRSYVSDGMSHLVDFQVDTTHVGEEGSVRKLDAPSPVLVKVRVAARLDETQTADARAIHNRSLAEKPYWHLERSRISTSRKVPVEVIVNGETVARTEIEADGSLRDLEWTVPITQSSWVALRIYPSSHTNPIFVKVKDQPIRASKFSAQWCLEGIDRCWTQKEAKIRPAERDEARKAYDLARDAFRKILNESREAD